MTEVLILTTGGTLDKDHDMFTESLVLSGTENSHLPELLAIGRCYHPNQRPIMSKDSLDMTAEDREAILQAVLSAKEDKIVITHGTGTMDQSAQYLDGKIGDKTVVFTGALRPFSLGKSDAGFNVGGALTAAQTLPAGVYAVMNGRVYTAKEIKKDIKSGRFDL